MWQVRLASRAWSRQSKTPAKNTLVLLVPGLNRMRLAVGHRASHPLRLIRTCDPSSAWKARESITGSLALISPLLLVCVLVLRSVLKGISGPRLTIRLMLLLTVIDVRRACCSVLLMKRALLILIGGQRFGSVVSVRMVCETGMRLCLGVLNWIMVLALSLIVTMQSPWLSCWKLPL